MSALRKYLDRIKPSFGKEGKLHAFRSVYEGFESFLYVPNSTAKSGTNIHDSIDSKRIMSIVVIALLPAMLFGMYNVGFQNYKAAGTLAAASFFDVFAYGFLAVLPKIVLSYIVGLGIEFAWAQWKGEEIQEGYLVSGILIPLIVPVTCPLWMLALAIAFAVIFCKEIFGGTGMNIFNVAIAARAFLFFSYPAKMTGDAIWLGKRSSRRIYHGNPFGRDRARRECALFYQRYDRGLYSRFYRRDKRCGDSNRGSNIALDGYRKLENDEQCLCWRHRNRLVILFIGHDTHSVV